MSRSSSALPPKDVGVAYVFWALTFVLIAGLQHFYLGRPVRGIIWLLTWGLFGIGTIYDLVTLRGQVRAVNARRGHGWV